MTLMSAAGPFFAGTSETAALPPTIRVTFAWQDGHAIVK